MRRLIEQYLVWFKMDLKISTGCAAARKSLCSYLQEDSVFVKEITDHFKLTVSLPYKINGSDPSQVATFKKIINALYNVEKAFQKIEHLDVREERYTLGILRTSLPISYNAVHELYAAIQLLNTSSDAIQRIVAPHIQTLLPMINSVSASLEQFRPTNPEEDMAKQLAEIIRVLPQEMPSAPQTLKQVSSTVFSLPKYFEKLQQLIAPMPDQLVDKTSIEEYKKGMEKKINQLTASFETLLSSTSVGMLPSYVSIIYQLVQQSAEILHAATPFSQKTYKEVETILNQMRHSLLPQLIAEVEHIEDDLCLKRTTLTASLLAQMDGYYKQLAGYAQKMADYSARMAAVEATGFVQTGVHYAKKGELPPHKIDATVPQLSVMRDDGFEACLNAKNATRLLNAEFEQNDRSKFVAAEEFFNQLGLLWESHLVYVPAAIKEKLWLLYQEFQSDFASLYPHFDKIIVDAIRSDKTPGIGKKIQHSVFSMVMQSSEVKQILASKASFMMALAHSNSTNELQVQLITQRSVEQSIRLQDARRTGALFLDSVEPFLPFPSFRESVLDPMIYRQKRGNVLSQLKQIEEARRGLGDFVRLFPTFHEEDTTPGDVRVAYKKLQPFILYLEKTGDFEKGFNEQWCGILIEGNVQSADLQSLTAKLQACFFRLNESCSRDEKWYEREEKRAKQQILRSTPPTLMADQLQKKTLFGQISALHLSTKVKEFMGVHFMPFLKQHLDSDVYDALAIDKLPYVDFYQDSPEVVLYKKLINALHHLQQSLAQIEEIHRKGDPSGFNERRRYVLDVVVPLMNAYFYAAYYIEEASNNPGFKKIINQTLEVIRPLHDVPLLKTYLQKLPEPTAELLSEEDVDMVKLWEQQQALVKLSLSGKPIVPEVAPASNPTATPNEVAETAPAAENSYRETIQKIAELLYKIPNNMREINNGEEPTNQITSEQQQHINEFVGSIVDSTYGASSLFGARSLKRQLESLIQMNQQLSVMGVEARHLVLGQVENMGTVLIRIANNAEFQLGLNVGTLTAKVRAHFQTFYTTLINHFPFPANAEQEKRILLSSTNLTKACLVHERVRHWSLKANKSPQKIRIKIFGGEHYAIDKIGESYTDLRQLFTQSPELLAVKEDVVLLYKKLQPYLFTVKPGTYTEDYLEKITDEITFKRAVNDILNLQQQVSYPSFGSFHKIKDMFSHYAANGGFAIELNKKLFLNYYQEIQPFLRLIDFRYDKKYFLRDLKSPHDFEVELRKIVELEGKLHAIVEGQEAAKQNKIHRCERRIQALKSQLLLEEWQSSETNTKLKHSIFDDYWKKTLGPSLKTRLDQALGPYAPSLFKKMEQALEGQKQELLNAISMKKCVLQIRSRPPSLAEQNEFLVRKNKNKLLIIKIGDVYEIGFSNRDGKYEQRAINIEPHLAFLRTYESGDPLSSQQVDKINKILDTFGSSTHMVHDIEKVISDKMIKAIEKIKADQNPIRTAYHKLNQSLEALDTLLKEKIDVAPTHPIYVEMIQKLNKAKAVLLDDEPLSTVLPPDVIEAGIQMANEVILEAEEYKAMIAMYTAIAEMKTYIEENDDSTLRVNQAKITELDSLQGILLSTHETPSERLKKVATRGRSQTSGDILEKHSDTRFIELLHQFRLLLAKVFSRFESKYDKMHSFFKEKNKEINTGEGPALKRS